MKKKMVLLVFGSLLCPMVLALAEGVVDSGNDNGIIESTEEASEISSSEKLEYTEAITSTSTETINRTMTSTISSEEESLEERIERLAKTATTPEEYQEVLEYIKKTTNYVQDENGEHKDTRAFSSRASQKMGVAQFLGISKQQLLSELQKHEYDNFYLGTPFRGLWTPSVQCMSPNGAPNHYGPGFNCTGFVATAFQRAGGDLRRITNVANAWGDVCNAYNWRDALRPNTEHYAFNSVNELLASGKAEKGDVIYFEPDYSAPNFDCHIGFFWGSRSNENLMWHSYDRNIKSNIKSATPFTKIYLFKLGDDKNAIIHDKKLNQERFIDTTNSSIYPSAYTSGMKKSDTTQGLYGQQVKVTREIRNGHGIWQEIRYKRNGKAQVGWVQSVELRDIFNQKAANQKLVLDSTLSAIYDRPYYPGAKEIDRLTNNRRLKMSVSEEAKTGYGEWSKVTYNAGSGNKTGWVRSSELKKIIDQTRISKIMNAKSEYGVIYDSPYTSPEESKKTDMSKIIFGKNISIIEEAYTGYGHWYRFEDAGLTGWINAGDMGEFLDYKELNTKKIINKNFGSVYDTPYVEGKTKKIDSLNGLLHQSVIVRAVATTESGIWFDSIYGNNKRGWIKSTDLEDTINDRKIEEVKTISNENGFFYDGAYLGPENTKTIGYTKELFQKNVKLDRVVTTGYGMWYHVAENDQSEEIDYWVKSTDLSDYVDYEELNTRKLVNKNFGAIYDSPYMENQTIKIDSTSGLLNTSVSIKAVAKTSHGIWYESIYGNNKKGWIKSTDLENEINSENINQRKSISNEFGVLYDSPYLGPTITKTIGKTADLYQQTIEVDYVTTTGYGTWYHFIIDSSGKEVDYWIKSTDLSEYTGYEKLDETKIVNKDFGWIYDSPYIHGITKTVGSLNGLLNKEVKILASAETTYGKWYEAIYENDKKGWIKSTDFKEE